METQAQRKAELARLELRAQLMRRYPNLTAVAKALDVPYKSVLRYLSPGTSEPRDVPFWFLIQALQALGVSLDDFMKPINDQVAAEADSSK